jgi:sporulation protein YlmC with PRC-barrel domain
MKTLEDVQTWRGRKVVDADGDKIGTVEEVWLDRQTGEPEWATVKTGLFGLRSSFVPIRDARQEGDGSIRVTVDKEQVKHAPHVDADEALSAEDERRLYEHYGRSDYDEWQGEDRTTALDRPSAGGPAGDAPGAGEGGDAPAGDDAVPAVVGLRLRRYVVVVEPPPDAP